MLVKTYAAALQGIEAVLITIETHLTAGVNFTLVGLPDNAVKESRDRIAAALMVNGYKFPMKQLTINMAPADIKKEGSSFDLPLALGLLAANEEIKASPLEDYLIMGELSLDGTLREVRGVLPMALMAKQEGFRGIIVPRQNAQEAAVVEGIEVYGMDTLLDVIRFIDGTQVVEPTQVDIDAVFANDVDDNELDFADVRGQDNVKSAMIIAAAGGHNLIMVGPPGAGKSMLAKRLPSILPPLSLDEAIETTKIHSVAGLLPNGKSLVTRRPFRSPHHTVSDTAMVGGGSNPQPGEISLANNGVLFADELPEYHRNVLESLRQPLEDRQITVSRVKQTITYPANFMLVAAMNPCPCGHYGDPTHDCRCTPGAVVKYRNRISGPLLDRFDLQVPIAPVAFDDLNKQGASGEHSSDIRKRVVAARAIQAARFATDKKVHCNAQMNSRQIRKYCALDDVCAEYMKGVMQKFGLSARAFDRLLKVARTIADLEGTEQIERRHLLEAVSYREMDKTVFGGV